MDFSLTTYEVLSLVAFVAGFLSALTGSSGIIILPALLLTGLSPHFALGTNKFFTTTSLFTAAFYYIKKGLFDPKFWVATTLAAIAGSVIGVGLTQLVSAKWLEAILPIIIGAIAAYMIIHKKKDYSQEKTDPEPNNSPKVLLLSSALGTYSGFIGAGTCAIWINTSSRLFRINLLKSNALSQYMCFITNLTSLIIFMALSEVHYPLGLCLAIFGVLGTLIGSKIAVQCGDRLIKNIIIGSTLFMSINLAVNNWFIS